MADGVIVHNCTQVWNVRPIGGIELDAPIETGPTWFARQSDELQHQVLGPAKFRAFKDGKLKLEDLHGEVHSRVWGTSHPERSLRDVLGEEAALKYLQMASV